jgi:hypothetical protein
LERPTETHIFTDWYTRCIWEYTFIIKPMVSEIITQQYMSTLKPIGLLFPKPIKKVKTKSRYVFGKNDPTVARRAKKQRVVARPAKSKRKRLPSIKRLKARADACFSIFIRNRDNNKCVLCNSHKDIQCGHLIKRGKMSTRYNEMNCNALCSSCNYKDNFEPQHYTNWFIKRYGAEQYSQLVMLSTVITQIKRLGFEKLIKKYASRHMA